MDDQLLDGDKTVDVLYEELRQITDGGSESMTHKDALEQLKKWSITSQGYAMQCEKNENFNRCFLAVLPAFVGGEPPLGQSIDRHQDLRIGDAVDWAEKAAKYLK